jgi:hypothetical protein
MIIPKPPHTFRFTFINIQGLPINPNSHKHQQIGTAIKETGSDTTGLAELNLNFPVLGIAFQWAERFRNLYRNHSVHTTNKHDSSKNASCLVAQHRSLLERAPTGLLNSEPTSLDLDDGYGHSLRVATTLSCE